MTLKGGLILIFFYIAAALGIFWLIFYPVALAALFWGIVIGIMGLICAGGARFVNHMGTAILLLLIGIAAHY